MEFTVLYFSVGVYSSSEVEICITVLIYKYNFMELSRKCSTELHTANIAVRSKFVYLCWFGKGAFWNFRKNPQIQSIFKYTNTVLGNEFSGMFEKCPFQSQYPFQICPSCIPHFCHQLSRILQVMNIIILSLYVLLSCQSQFRKPLVKLIT